ncbi:MAG: transcription elongation factor GreA [Spirochaetales bacterium]|jgi:transcription elongation factor GreA|nr:transcription elongation factor GreA [Spirochaetales bacterium]
MSEVLLKEISELLNEEKWTRATLNSYTISNFKDLDVKIEEVLESEDQAEVKELCDEHLQHTKNSIIGLYISGVLALSRQQIDDSNLVTLITIFTDNHKWNIVEFLCKRILQFGENKFALRTLAESFDNENEDDKKFDIWDRLIKVDYEEADIVRQLADHKESLGETAAAIDYYKKAIHRYTSKKLFAQVKEIWHKLITYCPEETDFFNHVDSKIAKSISPDRASQLLEDLYGHFKTANDWIRAIGILKRILDYDSKNQWARKEIVECYKGRYSEHSHLDEYIRLSNLNQTWRNVHEAIEDFEKHISFDAGNFVFHRTWGVGRISSIEDDEIVIDFARKREHSMSLKMAVSALASLTKDHIWVLRSIWPKQKLHDKLKGDHKWGLSTIIRSHGNAANMKTIKSEVAPAILTPGEWTSWSTEARKILKTDPDFGTLPDQADYFVVRETPISYEEKTFNRFRAEKNFFGRLKTMQEYLAGSDPESDFFAEMFDYFTGFLKSFSVVNEIVVSCWLLVENIVEQYPFLNPGLAISFSEIYDQIEDVEALFTAIEDAELQHDFLLNAKETEGWADVFVRLFPYYMNKYIIDTLMENGEKDKLAALINTVLGTYREYRAAFIWLVRTMPFEWFSDYNVTYEKILIGMIHLLDITHREIENRRDVSENRKLNRAIMTYLFKEKRLEEYILEADVDSISRIFTLIDDVGELDPSAKIELKQKIMDKYPDFRFFGVELKESVSMGLLVTAKSYEEHTKELQHLLDVDVPENSKEIGVALQMGDLRENAEYKAAKEKQEVLNATAARMKDEIEKSQIFDEKDVDTSKISFSTTVTLQNETTSDVEEYTILGPWESDPSSKIISYLSPFGSELWHHTIGEKLEFTINDREHVYTIKGINSYNIESTKS